MPLTIATPDGQRIEWDQNVVVIGTDPDCDLCIAGNPDFKPRHARIHRVEDSWQIDALDNGSLQVNSGPWSISHILKPGDLIRLSKAGPEIKFNPAPEAPAGPKLPTIPVGPIEELDAFRKPNVVAAPSRVGIPTAPSATSVPRIRPLPIQPAPPPRQATPQPGPDPEPAESRRASLLWVAFIAAIALISGGAILFFPPGGTRSRTTNLDNTSPEPDPSDTDDHAPQIADSGSPRPGTPRVPTPVEPESETETETTPEPTATDIEAGPPVAEPAGRSPLAPSPLVPAATPEQVDGSLYAVLLQSEDKSRTWRIGTACAVSDRQLATSAAIVLAAEHLRQDAKVQVLVAPLVGEATLPVIHLLPHPGYRQALTHWGKVQSELATITTALEKAAPEESERLKERQSQFQQHADQFARQQLWYDVGMLTVADALPFHLHIGYQPTFPDTPAKLVGLPFPADAPDAATPERQEHATQTAPWGNSNPGSAAWTVAAEFPDASLNWTGSPVLAESGNLLGIYSRPAEGRTHLITDAGRVRELLARP